MNEREEDVLTPYGLMNTFVVYPDEGGPYPAVLFFMDAPGNREELHDMARRLASAGYFVVLPNLYYRRVRDFVMTPGSRAEMVAHMNSLSNAMVCEDALALLDLVDREPAASSAPVGVVGYCMSGPFAFALAAALPEKVAAAASFHGVRLCTEAELYFGCAEIDEWAPREMIDELDQHLAAVGARYRIEWYPGTQHGFVFPNRGDIYDKAAAEQHWQRLLALFQRCLGTPA